MPVLDGDFEAFVTNLGKYNEGMLVGEWVKLPTTEEEMQKVFERIGIGKQDEFGQPYEEWFITDYECPIYGVQKMLGEYENLDKLNYLASLIDELSLSDQEKLAAIMEAGCDEVSDIDDLINLTFNLDCYDIMPGINDESDLGYYYAHEAGIYSEKDLGPLANYIDYERYGRDIAMDEQGRFTDEGYVRVASERWDRQFDGELDDIPDEYRITGSGETAERDSTIAVLVVEPGKEPYVKEIDSGLESLQHEVGGCIEAIYPYEDPVALVCNEEGKLEGLPLNRALRDEDGDIYDVVAGTFMVVGCLDGSLQVAGVVQSIENTDHINAVGNALLYKVLNGVVSIGAVAQHVLAAEQHLQFLMRQFFTQDAQTLPRIFVQKADAGVKRCAAPALHREVRDLVHFGQDGTHFIHRHTGGQQRLMRITQNDFGNLNRFLSQSRSPHFLTFGIVYALSAHGVQHIAGVDGIALANVNAGNGAVLRCADLVFHLHGFEDHDNIASLNSSACLDLDVQDGARHGSVDRNRTSGSGCGRCSSRSRCSGGCRSGCRGSSRSSAVGVFFNGNVVSNAVHGNSQVFHKKDPP